MEKGTIVLVRFPFSDLEGEKLRPAVVLAPENEYGDVCLAFVTSRLVPDASDAVVLQSEDTGFGKTGLKVGSTIRVGKIVTVEKHLIAGKLGALSRLHLAELDAKLRHIFKL